MAHLACLHCDLLINVVDIRRGEAAICPRCHQKIYLDQQSFSVSLALLLTALLLYFPAVLLPFLHMETIGNTIEVSLYQSVIIIAHDNMMLLAVTVFCLVILFPFVRIVGLLLIMLPLARGRLPFNSGHSGMSLTRVLLSSAPWNMVEVYLVGALVTLVKLTGVATISFSLGFYTFALILVNALIGLNLPDKRIWQSISALKNTPLSATVDTSDVGASSTLSHSNKINQANHSHHVDTVGDERAHKISEVSS